MPKKKNSGGRANPILLAPLDKKTDALQVIIETPKGSRNKYAFDENQGLFLLKKVLPAGMAFPYDFGFVPSTRAEDGDPVDVLVLMGRAGVCGLLVAMPDHRGDRGRGRKEKRARAQ